MTEFIKNMQLSESLEFISQVKTGSFAELQEGIICEERKSCDIRYIEIEQPDFFYSFSC